MIDDHIKAQATPSQSWMEGGAIDRFSASLLYTIFAIFSIPLAVENTRTVWCGLRVTATVKFNLSDPFMTADMLSGLLSVHSFSTCSFGTGWSSDKLVHIKSWKRSHQKSSHKCLNKHLPLCWLPYMGQLLSSHMLQTWFCVYGTTYTCNLLIKASCRAVMSWWKSTLLPRINQKLRPCAWIYAYDRTKFLAVKGLTWGQTSRASYIVRFIMTTIDCVWSVHFAIYRPTTRRESESPWPSL